MAKHCFAGLARISLCSSMAALKRLKKSGIITKQGGKENEMASNFILFNTVLSALGLCS